MDRECLLHCKRSRKLAERLGPSPGLFRSPVPLEALNSQDDAISIDYYAYQWFMKWSYLAQELEQVKEKIRDLQEGE